MRTRSESCAPALAELARRLVVRGGTSSKPVERRADDPRHGGDRGRRDPHRLFAGDGRAGLVQTSNCPMSVTRLGLATFVVRCITEARPCPASAARSRRSTVTAPEGCLVNAASPGGCRRGKHRDVVTHRRRCSFSRALGGPGAGARGPMNNVALGNDRFTYYEDDRRRPGARAPKPTGPVGRARCDVEHADHAPSRRSSSPIPLRVERWHLRTGSGGSRRSTAAATEWCASWRVARGLPALRTRRAARHTGPHGAKRAGEDGEAGRTLRERGKSSRRR